MATIFMNCCCGKDFIVVIEGEEEFVCPQCNLVWKRIYNQIDHTYNIIVKEETK